MKNNSKKILKVYGAIGKSLCSCAGGIVGFVLGGPVLAIPGAIAGFFGGKYLEKGIS